MDEKILKTYELNGLLSDRRDKLPEELRQTYETSVMSAISSFELPFSERTFVDGYQVSVIHGSVAQGIIEGAFAALNEMGEGRV